MRREKIMKKKDIVKRLKKLDRYEADYYGEIKESEEGGLVLWDDIKALIKDIEAELGNM